MDPATLFLTAIIAVTILLAAIVALRPSLTQERGGKILAFVAFCILPVGAVWGGVSLHMEHSKTTEFCLSCHVMEPYGDSLLRADTDYVPASHYQNHLIEPDHACFSCHTEYTMFGDLKAKLKGLQHVYVNYLGEIPEKIELYAPYENRECLHCHAGARSYVEMHEGDLEALEAGEISCLECHDLMHEVESIADAELWEGATLSAH